MTTNRVHAILGIVLFLGLCLGLANGCRNRDSSAERTEVSIFAASSLTEAFQDLEREFECTHPDVDIQIVFAGSQVLRLQIEHGAAADVFASANEIHMQALVDAGLVSQSKIFGHNELVVIVPTTNPAGIDSFDNLARARRIVIGTDNVPIGIYTRQVLDRAITQLGGKFVTEVRSHVVSEESNVRLLRAKVELAEADAAFVYRTDAISSDRVRAVDIPDELNVGTSYQIGCVVKSSHAVQAEMFLHLVLSDVGRRVLSRHGFVLGAQ